MCSVAAFIGLPVLSVPESLKYRIARSVQGSVRDTFFAKQSDSKQKISHADRWNFSTPWQYKVSYGNSNSSLLDSFGREVLDTTPLQPQPYTKRFSSLPLPQTLSGPQPLHWWRRRKNGRHLLVIEAGSNFLWRGYIELSCKEW